MYLAREGERRPSASSGAPEVARRANKHAPIYPHVPINMIYFYTHVPSYFIVARPRGSCARGPLEINHKAILFLSAYSHHSNIPNPSAFTHFFMNFITSPVSLSGVDYYLSVRGKSVERIFHWQSAAFSLIPLRSLLYLMV